MLRIAVSVAERKCEGVRDQLVQMGKRERWRERDIDPFVILSIECSSRKMIRLTSDVVLSKSIAEEHKWRPFSLRSGLLKKNSYVEGERLGSRLLLFVYTA